MFAMNFYLNLSLIQFQPIFSYFGEYCAIEVFLQQQKSSLVVQFSSQHYIESGWLRGEAWKVAGCGVEHATSPADAMQFPLE
jgi:hypothetical protein